VIVVIPTDDCKKVKVGHFGDARYYLFYEVKDKPRLLKKIENPYKDIEEEHGTSRKREKILELIKDADIVVYTFFGPGGEEFMVKHGKTPIRVNPGEGIDEVLERLLGAGDPTSPVGNAGSSSQE